MKEVCEDNDSYPSPATVGELKELFGSNLVTEVWTAGQLNDQRHKHSVWVLDIGKYRMVAIKGACPALKNGVCTLTGRCPK